MKTLAFGLRQGWNVALDFGAATIAGFMGVSLTKPLLARAAA